MIVWEPKHDKAHPDMLGFIPLFINERDKRSVREQLDANYQHGGGWRPITQFKMMSNGNLYHPGDPPYYLLYEAKLRDEIIRFYTHEMVAIVQKDGSFEVARMS